MTAQEVHGWAGLIALVVAILFAAIGAGCGEENNKQAESLFMALGGCVGMIGAIFLFKWLLMFFIQ